MFTQDQKLVLLQIAGAILFNVPLVVGLYYWLPLSVPPLPTTAERVFFTLRCQIFPVLMLLAGVLAVANVRFVTPAINPLAGLESERLQVHLRYLTNTLEQCVLFFFATTILATVWEGERMKLIPIMSLVFVVGRVTFGSAICVIPGIGRSGLRPPCSPT